jgi:hypothetical protein
LTPISLQVSAFKLTSKTNHNEKEVAQCEQR